MALPLELGENQVPGRTWLNLIRAEQINWSVDKNAGGKNLSGLGVLSFGAAGYLQNVRAESGNGTATLDMPLLIRKPIADASGNYGAMLGFGTEHNAVLAKAGIAFVRTGDYGVGALHFLVDSAADASPVSLADTRIKISATGDVNIGATEVLKVLASGYLNAWLPGSPAGVPSGCLWVDSAAGNVVKRVP
jgi:hypothetical protein